MYSEAKQIETSELEQIKVYFCVKQGEQVAHAQKKPRNPQGFQWNIFKGKVRQECPRVCGQLVHNFLIFGWWWSIRRC